MTTSKNSDQELSGVFVQDIHHRLRLLEQLPPRVTVLETSYDGISVEVREIREEMRTAHKETSGALNAFRRDMEDSKNATAAAVGEISKGLNELNRNIAFLRGVLYVCTVIGAGAIVFKEELFRLAKILVGA